MFTRFARLAMQGRGQGRGCGIRAATAAALGIVLGIALATSDPAMAESKGEAQEAEALEASILAMNEGEVQEIEWGDLMPEGWDPLADLAALAGDDLESLSDDSLRAVELFNAYQDAVRSAPVVGGLDGRNVRLPGFVVPLDFEGTETSEFLLVPYFGACIHVPPPPSNQIVYVKTVAGYPLQELFDPVWVTGVISTEAHLNDVGDAGYTMQATIIEPY